MLERCRLRCQKKDWILDLAVQKFFDSVDHDLMIKAVEANISTDQSWVVLYVRRWLTAPLQQPDGTLTERDWGTPQGSAVSPVLANLFMHFAFDTWLEREFPTVEFERYADDAVVHCVTERQARAVWAALQVRMAGVGLRLHPDKTKIVYCKDNNRRGSFETTSFTFLGYMFCPPIGEEQACRHVHRVHARDQQEALKRISREVRGWRIHTRTRHDLDELAERINAIMRGWMTYFGRFTRTKLHLVLKRINGYLVRWARKKYRRLDRSNASRDGGTTLVSRNRDLFAHWQWTGTFEWIR